MSLQLPGGEAQRQRAVGVADDAAGGDQRCATSTVTWRSLRSWVRKSWSRSVGVGFGRTVISHQTAGRRREPEEVGVGVAGLAHARRAVGLGRSRTPGASASATSAVKRSIATPGRSTTMNCRPVGSTLSGESIVIVLAVLAVIVRRMSRARAGRVDDPDDRAGEQRRQRAASASATLPLMAVTLPGDLGQRSRRRVALHDERVARGRATSRDRSAGTAWSPCCGGCSGTGRRRRRT